MLMKLQILAITLLAIFLIGCSSTTGLQQPSLPENYQLAEEMTMRWGEEPATFGIYAKDGDLGKLRADRLKKWLGSDEFTAWGMSTLAYDDDSTFGQNATDDAKKALEAHFAGWNPAAQAEDMGSSLFFQPVRSPDNRFWVAIYDQQEKATCAILFPQKS